MKNKTKDLILTYIKEEKSTTAHLIIKHFGLSNVAVYRHLNKLLEEKKIVKVGTPPMVFYFIPEVLEKISVSDGANKIDENLKNVIDKNYLLFTPYGKILEGFSGFNYWCNKYNLNVLKTAEEYYNTIKKYAKYKKRDYINGLEKIKKTFKRVYIDEMWYLDFYSIERFGKTRLGTLLLYAKQTGDKKLIRKIFKDTSEKIYKLIKEKNISAVGFVPPTIKRSVQFQVELEKLLSIGLPKVKIVKVVNEIAIPQKSLNKLEDRIENARKSIIVDEKNVYDNILIIDDAVGSGATMNETARKIREKGLCRGKLIGLALVGSIKGFQVINEI